MAKASYRVLPDGSTQRTSRGTRAFVFFDEREVIDSVEKGVRDALRQAGARIRLTARRSIRKRNRVSRPGSPPSSHTGNLRKGIYFGYDRNTKSVVVGPYRNRSGNAPNALEYGGPTRMPPPDRTFQVGDMGVMRLTPDNRPIYSRLRSERQVERAQRLYREYQTSVGGRAVVIEPRPYMTPALEANRGAIPELFRDSVRVQN